METGVLALRAEPQIRNRDHLREYARRLPRSTVATEGNRIVWDLGGGIIDGRKCKRYRSKQDERNAGLDIRLPELTIRNGSVRQLWGGFIFRAAGGAVENMVWMNVGEDAVSTVVDRAPGFKAQGCTFHNDGDGDKSIQLNDARDAIVENCTIFGGTTGIRWQEHETKDRADCYARGNRFVGVETAHNVAGEETTLHLDDASETYDGVRKQVVTSYGAKIQQGKWTFESRPREGLRKTGKSDRKKRASKRRRSR